MEAYWAYVSMFWEIFDIGAEAVFLSLFFMPYFPTDKRKCAPLIGAVFALVLTVLYVIPCELQGVTAYSLSFLGVLLVTFLIDRTSPPRTLFLAVTAYLLRYFSAGLSLIPWDLLCRLTFQNPRFSDMPHTQLALYALVRGFQGLLENLLFFFSLFFVNRVCTRKTEPMLFHELLLFTPYLPILFSYWLFSYFSNLYAHDMQVELWDIHAPYLFWLHLFQIVSYAAVLVLIFQYQKLKTMQSNRLQDALLHKQMAEMDVHIRAVEPLYRSLREIRHDIRHHTILMQQLFVSGAEKEALAYLKEWEQTLSHADTKVFTGNPIMDILISEKKSAAERKGIRFDADFHCPALTSLLIPDLGALLANALENAIEGAAGSTSAYISLSSHRHNRTFLIEVKNSFAGTLLCSPDTGLPLSSKPDPSHHGYGFSNIRKICERYCGTAQLVQDGAEVTLTALLII